MATYTCSQCDMAVNASCAKCATPVENGSIATDDGAEVQVSQFPSCNGMIKSPLCCGEDMSCTV